MLYTFVQYCHVYNVNTAYKIACYSVITHALFVALQKLASSDDEEVSKEASGALWELGEHKENAIEKTAGGKQGTGVLIVCNT